MTFLRTVEMEIVRSILTDLRCWHRMTDDDAPSPESFVPSLRQHLAYIIAYRHARPVALFLLVGGGPPDTAEVHFCMTPETWGRERTARIGREFLEWVWRETSLNWLIGPVPAHNRLAKKLAEACGFAVFGEQRGCITKGGKRYDRILMSIKRPGYVG